VKETGLRGQDRIRKGQWELQALKRAATLGQKSTIFWDITLCSFLKVNQCFGGIYRLHLHGQIISRARYQHENRWQAASLKITSTMKKMPYEIVVCMLMFMWLIK
jgi:hypothetical protein